MLPQNVCLEKDAFLTVIAFIGIQCYMIKSKQLPGLPERKKKKKYITLDEANL